jgi:nucleoside-diphosphate-sugar epimerase
MSIMNKICRNVLVTGGAGFIGLHLVPQPTTMITIITIVNTNVISPR